MSGFYIGVDGKARKVKGGYIGIDGKARKIKKGYIGVDGVARLCWVAFDVDPVFAENTWENIALACQSGAIPDTWSVGNQKTMTIGGTDYAVDVIGVNHDDYADGSGKAPLTLQLHDIHATKKAMDTDGTNYDGWNGCDMRVTYLPEILALMPTGVQANIKEVNKLTSGGGQSSEIKTTAEKLFLLSEVEVFNSTRNSFAGEGTQYEFYKNEGANIKSYKGSADLWWLRSPYKSGTGHYCCSTAVADAITADSASKTNGISFAFCF